MNCCRSVRTQAKADSNAPRAAERRRWNPRAALGSHAPQNGRRARQWIARFK